MPLWFYGKLLEGDEKGHSIVCMARGCIIGATMSPYTRTDSCNQNIKLFGMAFR